MAIPGSTLLLNTLNLY